MLSSRGLCPQTLLVLACAVAVVACNGGEPSPDEPTPGLPDSVQTASPSPTPVPVDIDLTLADDLNRNGEYEQALAIYSVAAQQASGETQRQALWGLAQTYFALGQTQPAADALADLLDRQPDDATAARARYLLSLAQAQLNLNAQAQASFRAYIQGDGPAAPYARIHLASLLAEAQDYSGAVRELGGALSADLPPSVRASALLSLARYQGAAGDPGNALLTYQQVFEEETSDSDKATALWNLALLNRGAGDEAGWRSSLLTLIRTYPRQTLALQALDQLEIAGTPAAAFDRAVVLFQHRRNAEAVDAFDQLLQAEPPDGVAAQARYYLGILAERRGDSEAALAQYEASLALDPAGALAPDAAWWRAQLLEGFGRLGEAVDAYSQLADLYPGSQRAPEAAFQAGLIRFRQQRYAEAIVHWTRFLDAAAKPPQRAKSHYWLGRAALAVADQASADDRFRQAIAAAPNDYYALRSQALLGHEPPLSGDDPLPSVVAPPQWPDIETWLDSWADPEDALARVALFREPRWQRGRELALMGLSQEAATEFAALLTDVSSQPWLLYRLARSLYDLGQTPSAARVAARLVLSHPGAPRALLAVAYPLDFLPLVVAEAEERDISPLLLLALIRQESLFDPQAVSVANALGLTQVIPSTGHEIAQQLAVDDFRPAHLLRPVVSVRFGAHYLTSQLEQFDGDLSAALAAYNGGPGNARRWRDQAPDDPDLFLEVIHLSETNLYVQLVLEHYVLYRYLFSLTDQPSLPLP